MQLAANYDTEYISSNNSQTLSFAVINSSLFHCNVWLSVLPIFLLLLAMFVNVNTSG